MAIRTMWIVRCIKGLLNSMLDSSRNVEKAQHLWHSWHRVRQDVLQRSTLVSDHDVRLLDVVAVHDVFYERLESPLVVLLRLSTHKAKATREVGIQERLEAKMHQRHTVTIGLVCTIEEEDVRERSSELSLSIAGEK